MPTFAPQRRAATAWLAPLPPKPRSNFFPKIVSPGRGNTSLNVVRSTLALPTTAIKDCLAIILFSAACSALPFAVRDFAIRLQGSFTRRAGDPPAQLHPFENYVT